MDPSFFLHLTGELEHLSVPNCVIQPWHTELDMFYTSTTTPITTTPITTPTTTTTATTTTTTAPPPTLL